MSPVFSYKGNGISEFQESYSCFHSTYFFGVDKHSCVQILIMLITSVLPACQMFPWNHQVIIRAVYLLNCFETVSSTEVKGWMWTQSLGWLQILPVFLSLGFQSDESCVTRFCWKLETFYNLQRSSGVLSCSGNVF